MDFLDTVVLDDPTGIWSRARRRRFPDPDGERPVDAFGRQV